MLDCSRNDLVISLAWKRNDKQIKHFSRSLENIMKKIRVDTMKINVDNCSFTEILLKILHFGFKETCAAFCVQETKLAQTLRKSKKC